VIDKKRNLFLQILYIKNKGFEWFLKILYRFETLIFQVINLKGGINQKIIIRLKHQKLV